MKKLKNELKKIKLIKYYLAGRKLLNDPRYYNAGKELLNDPIYKDCQEKGRLERSKKPSRTVIINYLLKYSNCKTNYLEIGVRNPDDNYNHILADNKYCVDPCIEFETNNIDFKMTSDEFFELLMRKKLFSSKIEFDVIFIDGLHRAEQVDRDITNSLKFIKDNGFIVLHDCNPPTEWHSMEDFSFKNSPALGSWNGTTWKAFLKWRFNPQINSCCIDSDWGVGILSKKRQIGKSIKTTNEFFEFSNLDANRKEYMNLVSYDDFINLLNKNYSHLI